MSGVHDHFAAAPLGIAPEHLPALAVAVATPLAGWLAIRLLPRSFPGRGWNGLGLCDQVAVALLAVAGTAHMALPFGHAHADTLRVALAINGIGFLFMAGAAIAASMQQFPMALPGAPVGVPARWPVQPPPTCSGRFHPGHRIGTWFRHWRGLAATWLLASMFSYVAVVAAGREGSDQFGVAVLLLELTALGLMALPRRPALPERWFGAGGAILGTGLLAGITLWGAALASARPGSEAGHGHASPASGVLMRSNGGGLATPAEQVAAARLATETRATLARFQDEAAARAAGYQPALASPDALVHYDNRAFGRDGRVLDPEAPEQLVYLRTEHGPVLLGAVYVMPRAGQIGPAVGGPLTAWHAHLVCIGPAPPFLVGIPSPFGGCPALSAAVTTPGMMHVWIVGDAYADKPDAALLDQLRAAR